MADAANSIFNRKATEKLRSPDDLDKYVQMTNPSVWAALAACIALLAGLLAWGIFGSVSTSVSATGVAVDGKVMCFLTSKDVSKVHVGDAAYVGNQQMKVADVAAIPLSRGEASEVLTSDYLVSTLVLEDWAFRVTFSGDASGLTEGIPLSVSITTERIPPLSLVFGSGK